MRRKRYSILPLLFLAHVSFAQMDVIKVVKEEKNSILFASVLDQVVQANATRSELSRFGRLMVNDTIAVSSYWITCWAGGAQHQRLESGEQFSGQTIWDINHVGRGGKIYFTNIRGHNIYTLDEYKIYNLVVTITD